MKIHLTILLFVLFLMMGMTGCVPASQPESVQPAEAQTLELSAVPIQTPVNQATPTTNPNAEVVLKMVESLNTGDVDGSLAYFADNALSYFIGMPPNGMEYYRGAEALRPMWEYSVSDHIEWEVEITGISGNLVYAKAKTWLDFTRELGVAPNEFNDVYQIDDGKITIYSSTMTGQALAKFKPAFYEVMPPETSAGTPSDPPASEMTVTIADGTCTTDIPANLQAGEVTVTMTVEDQGTTQYALYLFTLDPGKDILDLMTSTDGTSLPSWANVLLEIVLGQGKSAPYTFTPEKGPVSLDLLFNGS